MHSFEVFTFLLFELYKINDMKKLKDPLNVFFHSQINIASHTKQQKAKFDILIIFYFTFPTGIVFRDRKKYPTLIK